MALLLMRQIAVLFLMMGVGYGLVKSGLLRTEDSRTISILSLYIVFPCTLIHAFEIDYTPEIRDGFLLALFGSVLIHILLFIVVGILSPVFHLDRVEKASAIYSNCGNLIIPLVTSLLGDEWVIYSGAFMTVQTFIVWTHGQSLMRGERTMNWKKIVTNPNVIGIVIGLILFFGRIRLPYLISNPMASFAATIGPLSMVLLGMVFASVDLRQVFTDRRVYLITFIKMILLPVLAMILLKLLGRFSPVPNAEMILLITLLAEITPAATTITQMAQLYDQNAPYASAINVLTTVVCIFTMPLIVLLYQL